MEFVDEIFSKKLLEVIQLVFPNLVRHHQDLLLKYLGNIIDLISVRFNFDLDKKKDYEYQFMQNDYKDARGLLLMLLPFINDDFGDKSKKLESLDDLYTKKIINCDINKDSPVYEYSNLQYGRCKIEGRGQYKNATEIPFDIKHIEDNYNLLCDTIKTVANKLYVNWINIRPFNLNYKETKLFKITNAKIQDLNLEIDNHNCIATGEIYNILATYVYSDITDIRWILYDVTEKINETKNYFKFTYILNLLIGVENCVKNINWIMLHKNEHENFNENWLLLIDAYVNEKSFKKISYENIKLIMVALISYGKDHFIKYVKEENKTKFDEINIDYEVDDLSDIKKTHEIIKNIMSITNIIDGRTIYEYLSNCFLKLSKTWYSPLYLTFNKEIGFYELNKIDTSLISYNDHNFIENTYVTIKCLYNYAKSLCIKEKITDTSKFQKKELFSPFWKSNINETKEIIINRLNDKYGNWFNITGILKRRGDAKADIINREIYTYLHKHLTHVVFTVLLNSGLLTEFVPDKELSDNKLLPIDTNAKRDEIIKRVGTKVLNGENKINCGKSINFIDNLSYDNHILVSKNTKKPYLDTLLDENGTWMVTYTMDWISQISTFHHYLNNRLMYVTGGTGQGKSTQFPKLILYAMKMCDYKINGFIACTAPRINAVTGNAEYISNELGIPILKDNDTTPDKKLKTKNYHIQYKHMRDKHAKDQMFGLKLQIMTDGILDAKINNHLLKNKSCEVDKDVEETRFGINNIYDIIMVDEAHEHDVYMDLILTKIRYPLYFNNDIKLMIISATMEDDEPKYRRYYRMINDNRMFPLNMEIKEKKLDRINVDRRIHISPPGQVTQFKVDEIYTDKKDLIKFDEYMAENIVLDILKGPGKEILLFQPGEKEILKSVNYINEKTLNNKNVIAVPYFAKLDTNKKQFIEKIKDGNKDKNPFKKEIEKKKDNSQEMKIDKNDENKFSSFDRIVIVGTDIAEASITIGTLTHVVDTGLQKINNFKPNIRSSVLEKQKISESSRIQRKGRVGRVAPGTVYYTYEKNTREKKRPYKISISNIADNLFNILCDSYHYPNEKTELFYKAIDLNNPHIKNHDLKSYKLGTELFINKQYYIDNNFYDYFGNGDIDYWDELPNCYLDGYQIDTLNDYRGNFYIIHPDEIYLERNIFGKIIKVTESNVGNFQDGINFKSNKIEIFWTIMKEHLFIVAHGNRSYKTEFGKKLVELKELVPEFNNNEIMLSYIYGMKYNCSESMQKLIPIIIPTIGNPCAIPLGNIFNMKKYNLVMDTYGEKKSDINAIIKLFDLVINWYNQMYIKLGLNEDITHIQETQKEEWNKQKTLFLEKLKFEDFSDFNEEYLKPLLSLYSLDKLSSSDAELTHDEMNQIKSYNIIEHNINKVNNSQYIENLKMLCEKQYIQFDTIINLYKNYRKFQFSLKNKNIANKLMEIGKLTPLIEQNHNSLDDHDKIIFCLIQGYQYNLLKRIGNTDVDHYFVNLLYPSVYNVYQLKKIRFKKHNEILIKNEYIGDTILYLCKYTDENDEETVNCIANVNCKTIAKLLPLIVLNKINNVKRNIISKQNYSLEIKTYVKSFMNPSSISKYNIINKYAESLMDVMNCFSVNFDKNNIEKLYVIIGHDKNYGKIKSIINSDELELEIKSVLHGGGNNISNINNNYNSIYYGGNYKFAKYLLNLN